MAGEAQYARRQLFAAIEDVANTAATTSSSDFIQTAGPPELTVTTELGERVLVKDSDTAFPDVPGGSMVQINCDLELSGLLSGTVADPRWGRIMQASGFALDTTSRLTIGAITSGPFTHGETVTQTGTSATAEVIGTTWTGEAAIYLRPISGSLNGTGLLTGGSSGATATPSAISTSNRSFHPKTIEASTFTTTATPSNWAVNDVIYKGSATSNRGRILRITDDVVVYQILNGAFANGDSLTDGTDAYTVNGTDPSQVWRPTLTCRLYMNGRLVTATGCRAQFSMPFRRGERTVMPVTIMGVFASDAEAANQTGLAHYAAVPPVFKSTSFTWNDGTDEVATFKLSELDVSVENGLVVRGNANSSSAEGYDEARIVRRLVTGSFNPDQISSAVANVPAALRSATPWRATWTLGSSAANTLDFKVGYGQFTSQSDGERDGVSMVTGEFKATGGASGVDDSEFVFHLR